LFPDCQVFRLLQEHQPVRVNRYFHSVRFLPVLRVFQVSLVSLPSHWILCHRRFQDFRQFREFRLCQEIR